MEDFQRFGCTPECATSFMDVSRILSGKQPTCKFCNTAWDPTQYPLCQAIKDKKAKEAHQVNPPGTAPAADAAKPPANAGEGGNGPKVGSGFTIPPPIPPGVDFVTREKVAAMHGFYFADVDVQTPEKWDQIKFMVTGITDEA